jgi:hypothetical protein
LLGLYQAIASKADKGSVFGKEGVRSPSPA